jgi:glycerol-3-phosphate dehydrogenase
VWQAETVQSVTPEEPVNPSAHARTFDREEALRRLESEQFDVLVIGGGITGAGVALDAASRGLRTALVERHDFASGTSSKSSKLVHGGLRYLQQRDFRLVYEALHERQILLENAPHLVVPLPFLIPLFGRDGVVNKAVSRTYSTALWMYDLTGGWRIGKRHQRIGRDEALAHLPTLKADRLVAAFIYYDARTDDARLTLTVARTAALNHGAAMVNYAEVTELLHRRDGRVAGAKVRVWTPGSAHAARSGAPTPPGQQAEEMISNHAGKEVSNHAGKEVSKEIEIKASVVINATGVWADDVRALDETTHPHSLRPAKGIHITVPRSRMPADIAAVIPARSDRRQIFVVPWADGDDVYLGTTDTDWDGPLDDPACLPQDIDYVIEAANGSTTSSLNRSDVTGVWAGLRPLLDPGDRHVSARTKDLSRRHTVHVSDRGVVTVTGGKMTTYRLMAEQTVDAAVKLLGLPVAKSGTRHLKLIGAPANSGRGANRADLADLADLAGGRTADHFGLSPDSMSALVRRHGTEVPEILDIASGRPELLEPLVEGLPYVLVEAIWAARHEMSLTLDDLLSRRTRSVLRRAESSAAASGRLAEMLAGELGRDPDDMRAEARRFSDAVLGDLERAGLRDAGLREADVEQVAR